MDTVKDIIVALINNHQIANTCDTDKNIMEICKAIDKICKQIQISK